MMRTLLWALLLTTCVLACAAAAGAAGAQSTGAQVPTPAPDARQADGSGEELAFDEEAREAREQEEFAKAIAGKSCAELLALGREFETAALDACRKELEAAPDSPEMIRTVAQIEFQAGDPERSAELWSSLIERQGWSVELARKHAMAVWRAGQIPEAEGLLRGIAERAPSQEVTTDLLRFLTSFDRWQEAADTARKASETYPSDCSFLETWAVAEAAMEHDEKAAGLVEKAVAGGCPSFRWTTLGSFPIRLKRAEYRRLLLPSELTRGLRELSDNEALQRLELLKLVMAPEAVPAVTEEVLKRTKLEVRFAGIGLLVQMGPRALDAWKRLLEDDDFILRKHALRRIREMADPAFVPLVEAHLEREKLPRNRALTQLVLGELLLAGTDPQRGQGLLEGIAADDPLYPVAQLKLSEVAEKRGDFAAAVRHVDAARAASPEVYVEAERIKRLRAQAGLPDPTPAPKPTPPAVPGPPEQKQE